MEKVPQPEISNNQERSRRERELVDKLTDRLGLKIDEGIKDTVIALRLLGLNTIASHEGKIHRYPIPYVDMASEATVRFSDIRSRLIDSLKSSEKRALDEEIDRLYDQLDVLDGESPEALKIQDTIKVLELKYKNFDLPKNKELEELENKIKAEISETKARIKDLLDEFYNKRNVPKEVKLETRSTDLGRVRLLNCGWKLQENEEDPEIRERRLKAFQAEMNDFTEFLKSKL